ncbi:MAG TPA: hypothetical protein VL137_03335, partial [Polyangiaceae bacterium]|nr:hypothetical protein [Polyangiaceae bacterium]
MSYALSGFLTVMAGCLLWGCGVDATNASSQGVGNASSGILVVSSDYQSTSIAALSNEGEIVSEQIVSSGSAKPGLSAALSGDAVLPTTVSGEEAVVIDRSASAVLSWLNLKTAKVRAQLSVATGFFSNPHDYVPISTGKAYVTRFSPNLDQDQEPYGSGHDVLIVDPRVPKITGQINLMPVVRVADPVASATAATAPTLYPMPDRAVLWNGLAQVLVVVFDASFRKRADSKLVSIDPTTDEIVGVHVFNGLTSCSTLALSPSKNQMAVGCNGAFNQDPSSHFPDSGIVLLQPNGNGVDEVARYAAADLGGEQISSLSYASEDHILFTSYGRFSADLSKVAAPD